MIQQKIIITFICIKCDLKNFTVFNYVVFCFQSNAKTCKFTRLAARWVLRTLKLRKVKTDTLNIGSSKAYVRTNVTALSTAVT